MAILGVPPGPVVGQAWQHLKEVRLEQGPLSPEAAEAELRALVGHPAADVDRPDRVLPPLTTYGRRGGTARGVHLARPTDRHTWSTARSGAAVVGAGGEALVARA